MLVVDENHFEVFSYAYIYFLSYKFPYALFYAAGVHQNLCATGSFHVPLMCGHSVLLYGNCFRMVKNHGLDFVALM